MGAPIQLSNQSLVAAAVGAAGPDISGSGAKGLQIFVNIPAGNTGTSPTLQVLVEGRDDMSGTYYTILDSSALAAGGALTKRLSIYPGLTAAANQVVSDALPNTWRIRTVIGGGTPVVTATVGVSGVL